MGKKEFVVEMETLYDSPYFLTKIRTFDVISNYKTVNLLDIYMFKFDIKNTITRCGTCLKAQSQVTYNFWQLEAL